MVDMLRRTSFGIISSVLLAVGGCRDAPLDWDQTASAVGPGQSSWQGQTIAGMNVRLYVPASSGPRGLMVVLHGCAQQNTAIGDSGNWGDTADRFGWVVAAPNAPGGGVLAGCWDYYGTNQSRTNKFNDDVLALVQSLVNDGALAIDPDRVYVSGLSSGASQAMVLGCLAPDVFAGVGINAGPTVGTTSGQVSSVATNVNSASSLCRSWAGSNGAHFTTQLTSIVYGSNDFVVATGYNTLNAQVMADVYDVPGPQSFSTANLVGANPAGSGQAWSDLDGPRIRLIQNTGLGHNWPSGAGGSQSAGFVNPNSVDYPEELASFFETYNRRTGGGAPDAGVPNDAGPAPDAGFVDAGTPPDAGTSDAGVPTGVTATLTQHIQAGRLTWAQFGTYYLQYGTAPFTLYQQPDGSWSDTPPSGPPPDAGVPADAGTPDAGAPPPDAGSSPCTSYTSNNYQHVQAGRATVCNFSYVCAVGSGDQLGLYNVFYTSTVRETSPGYYEAGACP
jgi:poly(3-hydroxybutyrate) depolymerase